MGPPGKNRQNKEKQGRSRVNNAFLEKSARAPACAEPKNA
jgi:hypothetical protein